MEDLQRQWQELLRSEPEIPKGVPTEEERRILKMHKQQVKEFLATLSADQRSHLQTHKQQAKAQRKQKSEIQETAELPPTVHVTMALNTNRTRRKVIEVQKNVDLHQLWKMAKNKCKVRGSKKLEQGIGSIYLSRSQQVLVNGDELENGDLLLISYGEAVDFGKQTPRHAALDLPNETPDYLLVLDFEATCNERGPAPKPQEIIEFPTLLLNVATGEVEDTFHYYVKPDVHPILSDFCTELTGITQERVNTEGISLASALEKHQKWLYEKGLKPLVPTSSTSSNWESSPTFLYLTVGDWDLGTCLPRQLLCHKKVMQKGFRRWINVKKSFESQYSCRAKGMTLMLKHFGLELEGRHHSGIDDCRNTARICAKMLDEGWIPQATSCLSPTYLPY